MALTLSRRNEPVKKAGFERITLQRFKPVQLQ